MPNVSLELAAADVSTRLQRSERFAARLDSNQEGRDPDPNGGKQSGYDDSTPYPFDSFMEDIDVIGLRHSQTTNPEFDSHGSKSSLMVLVGSIVIFMALVVLAALRPWDANSGALE